MDVETDLGRIRTAHTDRGFEQDRTIFTSTDPQVGEMMAGLPAEGLAVGFPGRLIPILFESATVDAIVEPSVGNTTGLHSHDDSSGLHLVIQGRARVTWPEQDGQPGGEAVLGAGDWVYVPAGMRYEIEIVENPARMLYKHR